ncbi:MAG: D-glucuronyl C5-epimerase family protein [Candidatus Bathyarchaeia archaeon]
MTQGVAISCFIRAFVLNGSSLFLNAAREASRPLTVEVEHGGVSCYDENGDLWIEEVPSKPPSHILNGFIYALMGLFDLFSITGDSHIEDILKKGISTLGRNIHKYDSGFWSLYQLTPALFAPLSYHDLHIRQLIFLYRITKWQIFRDYAIKFNTYMKSQKNYLLSKTVGNILYLNALFKMQRLHAFPYVLWRITDITTNKILG